MTATKLRLVSETREQRIERALKAMGDVVVDLTLPIKARKAVWRGYVALHACRPEATVAAMEKEQRLRDA